MVQSPLSFFLKTMAKFTGDKTKAAKAPTPNAIMEKTSKNKDSSMTTKEEMNIFKDELVAA